MTFWLRIGGAVLSGVLTAMLFPPYSWWPLAWVSMLPLLAALSGLKGRRAWKGAALGFIAGAVACLIQFAWLTTVSWLGAILPPLYLALFWAAFGAFAAGIGRVRPERMWRGAFAQAAVWAGLEWLRGWLFTGFAWNPLGVAFHDCHVPAQAADLLGVGGLSLMLVFIQAILLEAGRLKFRTRLVAGAALLVLAVWGYGKARIVDERRRAALPLKVLMVQLNVPQQAARQLWTDLEIHQGYEDETLAALARLKNPDGSPGGNWPDWVLWPETALTGKFLLDTNGDWATSQTNLDTLDQVSAAGPFTLICGANEIEPERTADGLVPKEDGRFFNSIVAFAPDGGLISFRKHHLVIFGETIPFVESVPWLQKIYEQQSGAPYGGSFSPGESLEALPLKSGDATVGAIPTICFEDSVARLTRKFAGPGPQVIVNVTNDGWFKTSAAAAQHFANARFRAIELRRPMLRCANTGVTAALDSTGSAIDPETGKPRVLLGPDGTTFTRGSLLAEVKVPRQASFSLFAVVGDWGLVGLAVLGAGIAFQGRDRPASNSREDG